MLLLSSEIFQVWASCKVRVYTKPGCACLASKCTKFGNSSEEPCCGNEKTEGYCGEYESDNDYKVIDISTNCGLSDVFRIDGDECGIELYTTTEGVRSTTGVQFDESACADPNPGFDRTTHIRLFKKDHTWTTLVGPKGNGDGTDASKYSNIDTSWVTKGDFHKAYHKKKLKELRFYDDSGREAIYRLRKHYQGRSLLSIVQECIPRSTFIAGNTNDNRWKDGLCTIGDLLFNRGDFSSTPHQDFAQELRIGVGDKTTDRYDWAVFLPSMKVDGSAYTDFDGEKAWSFGGENAFNNLIVGDKKARIDGRGQGVSDDDIEKKEDGDDDGVEPAMIIAGVVAGVVVLLTVAAGAFAVWYYRDKLSKVMPGSFITPIVPVVEADSDPDAVGGKDKEKPPQLDGSDVKDDPVASPPSGKDLERLEEGVATDEPIGGELPKQDEPENSKEIKDGGEGKGEEGEGEQHPKEALEGHQQEQEEQQQDEDDQGNQRQQEQERQQQQQQQEEEEEEEEEELGKEKEQQQQERGKEQQQQQQEQGELEEEGAGGPGGDEDLDVTHGSDNRDSGLDEATLEGLRILQEELDQELL